MSFKTKVEEGMSNLATVLFLLLEIFYFPSELLACVYICFRLSAAV